MTLYQIKKLDTKPDRNCRLKDLNISDCHPALEYKEHYNKFCKIKRMYSSFSEIWEIIELRQYNKARFTNWQRSNMCMYKVKHNLIQKHKKTFLVIQRQIMTITINEHNTIEFNVITYITRLFRMLNASFVFIIFILSTKI